ncbi:MAG: hypothetical protein ABI171_07155 [Collimonas sp.]|uniref:hypothetical protein n=1 Tax=Collimonas sp. TaxID=1963772 RepID=UPI0032667566
MRSRLQRVSAWLGAIAVGILPSLAQAAFAGAGDFYAGALHPLTSPWRWPVSTLG